MLDAATGDEKGSKMGRQRERIRQVRRSSAQQQSVRKHDHSTSMSTLHKLRHKVDGKKMDLFCLLLAVVRWFFGVFDLGDIEQKLGLTRFLARALIYVISRQLEESRRRGPRQEYL